MRYFMISVLLIVLASMASAQDSPVAEAYTPDNDLGIVTVDDLATDGQIITLKGVQVWPQLHKQEQKRVITEAVQQKNALFQRVIDRQIQLQKCGNSTTQVTTSLVDMFRDSPLVKSATLVSDSYNSIEITWVNESTPEYFDVVPTDNRPTWEERIQQELEILQIVIECGCIIIIGTECRQIVPVSSFDPNLQEQVRAEITAARNGTWKGGMLQPSVVKEFRHSVELPVRQED